MIPTTRAVRLPWGGMLGVMAGVAGLFLLQLVRSVVLLHTTVSRSPRLSPEDRRHARLTALAAEAGLARVPRLVACNKMAVPFVWGVVRPTIALPTESARWTDERLDGVLRHELAHVRRHDVPVRIAAELLCALHWFNPLAWAAARRLRAASEAACDDAVLVSGIEPSAYAGDLLALFVERQWQLRPAGAMAGTSPVGERVERILDSTCRRADRPATRRVTAAAILGLVLGTAAFAPAWQTAEPGAPTAIQFRFQTETAAGAVFTEGPVDLMRAGGAVDRRQEAQPGFFLAIRRDDRDPLRTAWVTTGPASSGRVRDPAGDRAWPGGTPGWLEGTLQLTAERLSRFGATVRWGGAPLERRFAGPYGSATGSVMTGLPATTEDGGRGTLVVGWQEEGRRLGMFACTAAGNVGGDATRRMIARIARAASLDELGAGACLVLYAWNSAEAELRLVEAWRTEAGTLTVRWAGGDASLSRREAEHWLFETLPGAVEVLG